MSTFSNSLSVKSVCIVLGFILLFPATAGAEFGDPIPTVKSVGLKIAVQINGKQVKLPATVAEDGDFTIIWTTVPNTATGCISNWSSATLPPSGSSVGSIKKSRSFVITCYGRGAAQSATMQMNVGTADLVVSSFSAVGLKAAKGQKGKYLALPFTLKASVRNTGKLPVGTAFLIKYMESDNGTTGWITSGERTIPEIKGSGTLAIEELPRQGNAGVDARYYQVCVDSGKDIHETREDNNCSKVLGPYSFVPAP